MYAWYRSGDTRRTSIMAGGSPWLPAAMITTVSPRRRAGNRSRSRDRTASFHLSLVAKHPLLLVMLRMSLSVFPLAGPRVSAEGPSPEALGPAPHHGGRKPVARKDSKNGHEAKGAGKAARKDRGAEPGSDRLPGKVYQRELFRLQAQLVTMQEWVRAEGARLVVVFEGRDGAGHGRN